MENILFKEVLLSEQFGNEEKLPEMVKNSFLYQDF